MCLWKWTIFSWTNNFNCCDWGKFLSTFANHKICHSSTAGLSREARGYAPWKYNINLLLSNVKNLMTSLGFITQWIMKATDIVHCHRLCPPPQKKNMSALSDISFIVSAVHLFSTHIAFSAAALSRPTQIILHYQRKNNDHTRQWRTAVLWKDALLLKEDTWMLLISWLMSFFSGNSC